MRAAFGVRRRGQRAWGTGLGAESMAQGAVKEGEKLRRSEGRQVGKER